MRHFTVLLGLLLLTCNANALANGLDNLPLDSLQRVILSEPHVAGRTREVVHRDPLPAHDPVVIACSLPSLAELRRWSRWRRDSTPRDAVLGMFDAYKRRCLPDYLASFDPDYRFDSDDSSFRAHHPDGMNLDDEILYASRLLAGEAEACTRLPHATRVRVSLRSLNTLPARPEGDLATVVIEGLRVKIDLSDGDEFDTGEAHHELVMVHRGSSWRVRRWLESDGPLQEVPADTAAIAGADSSAARAGAAGPAIPDRLGVIAFADHSLNALVFNVGLPRAGGVLMMFDLQGRQVARRDLDGLRPGYHRVSIDGSSYAAGIYWARVRQGETQATTRVVWMR